MDDGEIRLSLREYEFVDKDVKDTLRASQSLL